MCFAYLISRRLFAQAVEPKFVERLFGTGYCVTAIMFLAGNMWLFLGGLALASVLAARRFTYPLALFLFLLLLMPGYSVQVPGFGLINYLIDLNPWRVVSLTLLLPTVFWLSSQKHLPKPGSLLADKLVLAFALYTSWLSYLHYDTFTVGLRQLAITTLDSLLIYFAASRGLMLKGAVRHVIVALVMAAIFLALVSGFEFVKHWLLYSSVKENLGVRSALFGYLGRGATLRVTATTGQPIVLGFVMMVALLMSCYAHRLVPRGGARVVLWMTMVTGLVAAMSRGPWVGAAIGLFVVALASTKPLDNVLKLSAASLGAAIVLLITPGGEKILDYLPWIGEIDSANIDFREILWRQSMLVFEKYPWTGSIDFVFAPEFDEIRTSRGFVDVVNTYVGVLLMYGGIGLGLYILLMLVALLPSIKKPIHEKTSCSEPAVYGMALTGTLVASIITISTVSSIEQIAPLLIFIIGAAVARASINNKIPTPH